MTGLTFDNIVVSMIAVVGVVGIGIERTELTETINKHWKSGIPVPNAKNDHLQYVKPTLEEDVEAKRYINYQNIYALKVALLRIDEPFMKGQNDANNIVTPFKIGTRVTLTYRGIADTQGKVVRIVDDSTRQVVIRHGNGDKEEIVIGIGQLTSTLDLIASTNTTSASLDDIIIENEEGITVKGKTLEEFRLKYVTCYWKFDQEYLDVDVADLFSMV